jgi:23S rRNA (cytosine1962-C5)-methyltransferase
VSGTSGRRRSQRGGAHGGAGGAKPPVQRDPQSLRDATTAPSQPRKPAAEGSLPAVRLRPGRDLAPRQRHPWVLSGSVASVEGDPEPGASVRVVSSQGETLGIGDYDPRAQIRVRFTSFGKAAVEPAGWLEQRLRAALEWRGAEPLLRNTTAIRLVNSEADGLPGLTIDRYADWVVLRVASPGMMARIERVGAWLRDRTRARGGWMRGELRDAAPSFERTLFGEVPEEAIEIDERGRTYWVDLRRGQKTGFYLDQRDARDLFQSLASGARVLDLFSYTGGFSTAAIAGGARQVVAVESSAPACALIARNAPSAEIVAGDVGHFLAEESREFDLLSIDPPPFARRKRDVPAACRAYHEIHARAFERAAPGAHVLSFTCSHHVDAASFRATLGAAARNTGRRAQLLRTLEAPPDHPVDLAHPQGEYLKGVLIRLDPVS